MFWMTRATRVQPVLVSQWIHYCFFHSLSFKLQIKWLHFLTWISSIKIRVRTYAVLTPPPPPPRLRLWKRVKDWRLSLIRSRKLINSTDSARSRAKKKLRYDILASEDIVLDNISPLSLLTTLNFVCLQVRVCSRVCLLVFESVCFSVNLFKLTYSEWVCLLVSESRESVWLLPSLIFFGESNCLWFYVFVWSLFVCLLLCFCVFFFQVWVFIFGFVFLCFGLCVCLWVCFPVFDSACWWVCSFLTLFSSLGVGILFVFESVSCFFQRLFCVSLFVFEFVFCDFFSNWSLLFCETVCLESFCLWVCLFVLWVCVCLRVCFVFVSVCLWVCSSVREIVCILFVSLFLFVCMYVCWINVFINQLLFFIYFMFSVNISVVRWSRQSEIGINSSYFFFILTLLQLTVKAFPVAIRTKGIEAASGMTEQKSTVFRIRL